MVKSFETEQNYGLLQKIKKVLPYVFLVLSVFPIVVGYAWLIIATFSLRTEGLLPVTSDGKIGGLTFQNWTFLSDPEIWKVTLNTFLIASGMVIGVGFVSILTGYALSRMNFPGRKGFLGMTLVLHAFRPEMLLIGIFLVLLLLSGIPFIGQLFGFNTIGGVALVMIALDLPLGVWLMKGFFDNLSWDMERAAMIDCASRFRILWEIIIPQIKPGIAALAIFNFITGWNAYLVPFTFTIGSKVSNLAVYINRFSGDTSLVSWNQVAAIGLFQLIPVMIFFIFTQELLLNIYGGGAKGVT